MKIKLKLLLAALALQVFCMGAQADALDPRQHYPTYTLTFDVNKVEPKVIDAYHGEKLEILVCYTRGGVPDESYATADKKFYWQEVGMGDSYWIKDVRSSLSGEASCLVDFLDTMDTGAKVYNCFVGSPNNNYRAAFQIRMRPSPGAEPSILPLPVKTLDFDKVKVENAPYYTKDEAEAATEAAIVSKVTKEYVEGLGITAGGGTVEVDTTLTQSGMAADAKKVGDNFSGLAEDFHQISSISGLAYSKAEKAESTVESISVWAQSHMGEFNAVNAKANVAFTTANEAKLTSDRVLAVMTANENVWFEATNYYGMAGIPASMQLYEKRDGETKLVWDQRNWVRWHVDTALAGKASELTSNLSKWSSFQSVSGEENPLTDTTWISTPRVALSGGFEWQKTTLVKANVFVLHSNGLAAISSPTEGSFFSVEDLDGTSLLTVKKTADQTLAANASAVSVDGQSLIVTYNVAAAEHPTLHVCLSLAENERVWYEETDSDCPCTVTWRGASGNWVATVEPKFVTTSIFAYAHYVKQGQTLIEMNGVAGASKGFVCSDDPTKIVKIIWNNGNPKFVEVE